MRAEREIDKLNNKVESQKEKIKKLLDKNRFLKRSQNNDIQDNEVELENEEL